jgi:hypothetical protein
MQPVLIRRLTAAAAATVLCIALLVTSSPRNAGEARAVTLDATSGGAMFQVGEELEYDVTFLSLSLGRIRVRVDSLVTRNGRPAWCAHCDIDSRAGIPFVSLHTVYRSQIDEGQGYSHGFVASDELKDGSWMFTKYNFDYPNKKFTVQEGKGNEVWKNQEIQTPLRWCDGCSLFFYARKNANMKKSVTIPTVMMSDTVFTSINFLGEQESQEIDAAQYPIDCTHFVGDARWTGVYGLTGKFEGWFSNDVASIPIKAKMKLYVGSVWVELVRWNRSGWNPPRAKG